MPTRMIAVVTLALSLGPLASAHAADDGPVVTFLDRPAAARAIVDESAEPYFALLQPAEMTAKTGSPITGDTLDAQRDEARRRYAAMTDAFTDDEQATLRWYVEKVHGHLARHYPKLAAQPWSFIKVSPTIEGGLPHTRGSSIVLSAPVIAFMSEQRKLDEGRALIQFAELLIHERVHVVQRSDPGLFRSLYTEVWHFEHADAVEPNAWLTAHQVVNPDGVDTNWVLRTQSGEGAVRYIWPRIVFAEGEQPRMPVDFRLIAIAVEKTDRGFKPTLDADGKPVHAALHQDAGYMSSIPHVASIYHPNELAADVIAQLIIANHLLPDEELAIKVRDRTNAAMAKEWEWMEKNLK